MARGSARELAGRCVAEFTVAEGPRRARSARAPRQAGSSGRRPPVPAEGLSRRRASRTPPPRARRVAARSRSGPRGRPALPVSASRTPPPRARRVAARSRSGPAGGSRRRSVVWGLVASPRSWQNEPVGSARPHRHGPSTPAGRGEQARGGRRRGARPAGSRRAGTRACNRSRAGKRDAIRRNGVFPAQMGLLLVVRS